MPDQTPLTDAELAEIKRRALPSAPEYRMYAVIDRAHLIREVDRLRAELHSNCNAEAWAAAARVAREIRTERAALAAKLDAADARIAELEELKCSVCGLRVAHLNTNGYVIGWGCANGDNCKDDRLVQARAAGWDEGYKSGVEDERTSEANIGIAGFGMKVNPARVNPYRSPAPESPRPPAVVHAPGSTADSRLETRTGVSEPENSAQASEVPDVDGWTLRPHPDGIGLYHSCDSRAFLTGPEFPVGAVLAYIADPPVPDGEPGYIAEAVACPACRAQSTEEETDGTA